MRWDQDGDPMPYEKAVQYSHHVLDLCSKSKANVKELFDDPEEEVENIRVRTNCYELIVAQEGNYILVIIYDGGQKDANQSDDQENSEGKVALLS